MTIAAFPPVEEADEDGLLAIGGDVEVPSLLLAYSSGIFPWPLDTKTLAWFSPPKRAVFFLEDLHIPRRLLREAKKSCYEYVMNRDFSSVIHGCAKAANRKGPGGTWITKGMIAGYIKLHEAGYCHSFECYQDGELVGGIYGVQIQKFFGGESMFYRKSNASKLALLFLCDYLNSQDISWVDSQVLNPFTISLGAREIPRTEYLALLRESLTRE